MTKTLFIISVNISVIYNSIKLLLENLFYHKVNFFSLKFTYTNKFHLFQLSFIEFDIWLV